MNEKLTPVENGTTTYDGWTIHHEIGYSDGIPAVGVSMVLEGSDGRDRVSGASLLFGTNEGVLYNSYEDDIPIPDSKKLSLTVVWNSYAEAGLL